MKADKRSNRPAQVLYLPHYMNEKRNVVRLVLYTAAFALLFLNIYQPFNSGAWASSYSSGGRYVYVLFSSLVILVGMSVIAISRVIMYYYNRRHEISLIVFAGVVMTEIALMALVYALFQVFVLEDNGSALAWERLPGVWGEDVKKTSLVLLLPYSILWLVFALQDKARTIEQMRSQEGSPSMAWQANEMVSFYDEKGDLRLSVEKNSLYYIESADNYVKIHYLNKGKMQHFMLRNSLKNIDELFGDRLLLRCHRSYMVNFDKVKVLRKADEGLCMDFDSDQVPNIPISKTYSARVLEKFSKGPLS